MRLRRLRVRRGWCNEAPEDLKTVEQIDRKARRLAVDICVVIGEDSQMSFLRQIDVALLVTIIAAVAAILVVSSVRARRALLALLVLVVLLAGVRASQRPAGPPSPMSFETESPVRNGVIDSGDTLPEVATDDDVSEAVQRLRRMYGLHTDAQFKASLVASNLTLPTLRSRLRDAIIEQKRHMNAALATNVRAFDATLPSMTMSRWLDDIAGDDGRVRFLWSGCPGEPGADDTKCMHLSATRRSGASITVIMFVGTSDDGTVSTISLRGISVFDGAAQTQDVPTLSAASRLVAL